MSATPWDDLNDLIDVCSLNDETQEYNSDAKSIYVPKQNASPPPQPISTQPKTAPLVDALSCRDPFPDVYTLFSFYDDTFFNSSLKAVEIGGYCSIRLSEPLLKYRSVTELKETLLHEMIHAYLFIKQKAFDRNGHGEDFQRHMHRINAITGFNITIYHTFQVEVDHYRRHIWRCNVTVEQQATLPNISLQGSCRNKPPFFGFLKRAVNREPGRHDFWWGEHELTCGGRFEKISAPQPLSSRLSKKHATKRIQHNTPLISSHPLKENKKGLPSNRTLDDFVTSNKH